MTIERLVSNEDQLTVIVEKINEIITQLNKLDEHTHYVNRATNVTDEPTYLYTDGP